MKIYTKTGDTGTTQLLGGRRVNKSDPKINLIGTLDELNSSIGLAISFSNKKSILIKDKLVRVQNELFDLGVIFMKIPQIKEIQFFESATIKMEREIDEITVKLPDLKNFVLPGGSKLASFIHHARTVCRRVERLMVDCNQKHKIDPILLAYINRMSDWLFTLARYANFKDGIEEIKWSKW